MDDLRKIKNLLTFIAVILAFAAVYVARDMFLPIMIGMIVALTFSPVVRSCSRVGIPTPVSAAAIIFGTGSILFLGFYLLSGPVSQIVSDAPAMGNELREKLKGILASIENVKNASEQVEDLASGGDGAAVVAVKQPGLLAFAAGSIFNFMALTGLGLIFALFILASGDLFYDKLVDAFRTSSDKRRAKNTARAIERQISRYFLTITLINAVLGLCVGFAMHFVGLPNAVLWGVVAFALNFLPFLGSLFGTVLVAAFGVLSFDTLGLGLLPAMVYALCTSFEAQFVTPTILGRSLNMNTVSVFLTVIIWSWLWSVPGALMAVPFLVMLKVICDNVPSLAVLGNFLGTKTLSEAKQ
ncbi:AI-2E family transporter [Sulfitobacter sp. M57]|uniref:AI-2E family transporter n=1 Tax=unclassified Sulfitobacter TaxID=196795 RepID=UPI0023E1F798|nr:MULTISPECIES: AI-2E family transporter [unclassified Sulfitobacter]MDF3414370.1 AI-2E family transporter [Sulfitobacter sp. KE5]MDF3420348.1 AI-2E family transporter [Sulfitobacter sp. KE43]MDF3432916.1 AI-2E family transporter [Sulfitobacter sp. KE42]MDF3458556.1 AI-2E family transporter [Sulfitobacter sp. S74]MDF3462456.1 AI-2E family transporter [Sulfitobacter sp. Ks18]